MKVTDNSLAFAQSYTHCTLHLNSVEDKICGNSFLKSFFILMFSLVSFCGRYAQRNLKRDLLYCRLKLKALFNPRFGSVFRTYTNSTYFTRRLVRFADLYMSSVENLLNYPLNYTFYPRRAALPHEAVLDFRTNRVPQYQTYPSAKN